MKKIFFSFIISFIILCSLIFPSDTVQAARAGLQTWYAQILPALLPCTILCSVLLRSKLLESFGKSSNLITIIVTLLCGFIFGFPVGAKLSSDFYKQKLLTQKQATILCIFANNFSIMYVFGYVMPTLFPEEDNYYKTCIVLYLIPLLIGITALAIMHKSKANRFQKNTASRFQFDMQIIDAGIISGFKSLIKICGYIVLFSIISKMILLLCGSDSIILLLGIGNLEITTGITLLSEALLSEDLRYMIAIQLLSLGGLSGMAQTASILAPAGIPIRNYVIGKIILTLFLIVCLNIIK